MKYGITDESITEKECLVYSRNDSIVTDYSENSENYEDESIAAAFPKQQESSLLLAIQAAVSQEDHLYSYLTHVLSVLRNSSTAVVCRTLLAVVAIFIFIIGVIRFRECPYEQELPLFLVLEGVAIMLKSLLNAINTCLRRASEENERNTLHTCSDILSIFIVLWTLTGTVWTYGIYSHVTANGESQDCDRLVYTCSLWFLIAIYCCVATFLLFLAIVSFYYKCKKIDSNKSHLPYEIRVDR